MQKPESIGVQVNGLHKAYRLGVTGRETFTEDLQNWWRRTTGRMPADATCESPSRPSDRLATQRMAGRPGWFWALQDVSFAVAPGDVLGIIGSNGAGKSTLLKILARITEPTGGHVRLVGRTSALLEVGTGFHPELTGRENVFINGAVLGMTEREIRGNFDAIIDFADMADFVDTPVKRYSSGMRTRLAFAVAVHLNPDVLLVDEVLAVGDAEFQKKCVGKMEQLAGNGRTVCFVSHRLASVAQLCNRAIWLDHGRIRAQGATDDVIDAYLSTVSTQAGEVCWQDGMAPSRLDGITVHAMRLINHRGDIAGAWLDNAPFSFEVVYELAAASPGLRLGFELGPNQGAPACVCLQPAADDELGKPGRHCVRVQIPGGVITPGQRQIALLAEIAGRNRAKRIGTPLVFDIEPSNSLYRHRGLVHITATWTTMPTPPRVTRTPPTTP